MIKNFLALLVSFPLFAASFDMLSHTFPEDYVLQGASQDEEVMICLHGFGMDKTIGYFVHDTKMVPYHLLGFNFPDFGEEIDTTQPDKLCFGTIRELKPAIQRLHRCVQELGVEKIHLYGFSAGGGATINVLGVLKSHRFQEELGLTVDEMDAIYSAIERGSVILDCPLKSIDEICDMVEKNNPHLQRTADIYIENDLRPIDSLLKMEGSALNVALVLQRPDDILSNRDDHEFVERLRFANQAGQTIFVEGHEGVHIPAMSSIMLAYHQLMVATGRDGECRIARNH